MEVKLALSEAGDMLLNGHTQLAARGLVPLPFADG
jgi:hypothetical protein